MDDDEETTTVDLDEAEPAIELDHGVAATRSRGQRVLHPDREQLVELVEELRAEGYVQCIDVCAVDYLDHPVRADLPDAVTPGRYEVVVNLINHAEADRIRLRVQVPDDDPTVPSLFDSYPGTEAMEREVFDMFGIAFDGHPDMTRILMPEEWAGHPLRKDYATGRVPVQFKGAPEPR